MKNFLHFNARSVEEAVSILKRYEGRARVIAGGTDILNLIKARSLPATGPWELSQPDVLVNIKTIEGLRYIKEDAEGLRIGATTTLRDIERSELVKSKYGALWGAASSAADSTLREMGTIAGNICQEVRCWYYRWEDNYFNCLRKGGVVCFAIKGDNRWYFSIFGGPKGCYAVHPSDTAVALMAYEAKVKAKGPDGDRTIPIDKFFKELSPGHVLSPTEVITEITVPAQPPNTKGTYKKFSMRGTIDFAIASAAAVITMEGNAIKNAKIAIGGVYQTPLRAKDAESTLAGKSISEALAERAANAAVKETVPLSMNAFKVDIVKALVKRAIMDAAK